jgi:N-acetylmuramic acid 6-phosphate (MurNAc-6-P) etherase
VTTGVSDEEAEAALAAAGGSAKVAVVALLKEIDADAAQAELERAGGDIRSALES